MPHLHRLVLQNFRNYRLAEFKFTAAPVVLCGPNGSGKTNVLEALTFLSVGRGMRKARLDEVTHQSLDGAQNLSAEAQHWDVSAQMTSADLGDVRLSVRHVQGKRCNKIQDEVLKSSDEFSQWLTVVWLTPAHDLLLVASPKTRRQFFDRLVFTQDSGHAKRLVAYEALLKERLSLLDHGGQDRWLDALEQSIADKMLEIYQARQALLLSLQEATEALQDPFPAFTCQQKGELEALLVLKPEADHAAIVREQLRGRRRTDGHAHMTTLGTHRSDFSLVHCRKGPAAHCSHGEQKMLIMGVMLTFMIQYARKNQRLLLMLFDECVSHFDFDHRVLLFQQFHHILSSTQSIQIFLTGTERWFFESMGGEATFFDLATYRGYP